MHVKLRSKKKKYWNPLAYIVVFCRVAMWIKFVVSFEVLYKEFRLFWDHLLLARSNRDKIGVRIGFVVSFEVFYDEFRLF